MAFFIIFLLSITTIPLPIEASDKNCPTTSCSHGNPDIKFPFQIQGRETQQCGHPGFNLSCEKNNTIIHFPSYGNLIVKSISYNLKKIDLLDPKSCVHEVFLNLNLSLTPFKYHYLVKNYMYINCSAKISYSSSIEVPCLSGSDHHVFVVMTDWDVPSFCRILTTVAIPFMYSPYLDDNSFGLELTWSLPECENCEANGGGSPAGLQSQQVIGISLLALMVGAVLMTMKKIVYLKKPHPLKAEEKEISIDELEKSLGEYKTLQDQLFEIEISSRFDPN